MRSILVISLLLFSYLVYSQNLTAKSSIVTDGFELKVSGIAVKKQVAANGVNRIIDYLDFTDFTSPGTLKLPYNELIVALPAGTRPSVSLNIDKQTVMQNSSVKLNPKYIAIGDSTFRIEEQDKPVAGFSNTASRVEVLKYFWYRDFYCAHIRVKLADYDYQSNSVKELLSYSLKFVFHSGYSFAARPIVNHSEAEKTLNQTICNADIAEGFRAAPPKPASDSTASWINYSASYLKIGISKDGIYRITPQDLTALGISASSIDPRSFVLFDRGSQYPIFVAGEEDGSFDAADYIELYARANYSPRSPRVLNSDSEEYSEYMNRYSDTTVFFLSWGSVTGGSRAPQFAGNTQGLTDTLASYTEFIHYEPNTVYQDVSVDNEKNQDPLRQDAKSWFGGWLFAGSDYSNNFTASDIVKGKSASLFARLISAASSVIQNSHNLALGLKTNTGTIIVDTRTINRNEGVVLSGVIPSDSIKTGTNSLVISNYSNGTDPNNLLFDWYEVEYPKLLKSVNDSLSFGFQDATPMAPRVIKIGNIASAVSDLSVYRTKPRIAKITGAVKSGTDLIFTDTVGTGYTYTVIANTKVNSAKPTFITKKSFVNLRSANRKADYIGITHPSLAPQAANYVGFIKNRYSVDTVLVLTDDIYDEFAFGYPEPASIKQFIKSSLTNWQSPKPAALCLIGQACYDYKRNFFHAKGYEINVNLVPAYGEPVTDTWYTMVQDTAPLIQQMMVGRIPAEKGSDIEFYLNKHKNYLDQRLDLWNKTALFFSGGNATDSSQILQLKSVNDMIVPLAQAKPLALNTKHFYKTFTPRTDFGPYDPNYIRKTIDDGGLFISYLGHSGTRTWDNSIFDPNQLLNKVNKSSLVTDFGCSTNKFAEPDVKAFGQLFVNTGQTISYIGNSSLGFFSTSTYLPRFFYESLLTESILQISNAHFITKNKMFRNLGSTGTYKIFALTNLLLGDPLVSLRVPSKPNLSISASTIELSNTAPNDQQDSVTAKISYFNYGTATVDSMDIFVQDKDTSGTFTKTIRVGHIAFADSVFVAIPIKKKPGNHQLTVQLDSRNEISEIYEDDNSAQLAYSVSSLALKPVLSNNFSAQQSPLVTVLGSAASPSSNTGSVIIQYDTLPDFSSKTSIKYPLDTFFTKVPITTLLAKKRYWARMTFDQPDTLWSSVFNLYKSDKSFSFYLEDAFSCSQMNISKLKYDRGLKWAKDSITLSVQSAGGNFVKYGTIIRNGVSVLANTFGWGMGCAIIDPVTFALDTSRNFDYGEDASEADSLAALIKRTPAGKILCLCVIDDGSINYKQSLQDAIKSCGSKLSASIGFRQPWVVIGVKGSSVGSAVEFRGTDTSQRVISFDTIFVKNASSGSMTTIPLAQASKYSSVYLDAIVPANAKLTVRPIGTKSSGAVDTLSVLTFDAGGAADISNYSTTVYPSLSFIAQAAIAPDGSLPVIKSFGVNFDGLPELWVNYQTVKIQKDTLFVGKKTTFSIGIGNAGTIKADSVKVLTEIVYKDNTKDVIDTRTISVIPAESRFTFSLDYNVLIGAPNRRLRVTVDPDNKITEYYKDNNIFNVPFTVVMDSTAKADVQLFVDSAKVFDGDYINSKPRIRVELNDPSLDAVNDTSFITMTIDDKQVYYNNPNITYSYLPANPKMVVDYRPNLATGSHTLNIFAFSASRKDTLQITRELIVNTDLQLMSVYNYPNPFKDKTRFTFQLSTVPDELRIRIYTVTGRCIRAITKSSAELNTGFNKTIEWDGRDEDGNEIANGVYLYKILIKKNGKTLENISKLAIIR